ncbi:hypothetical protein ASD8599_01282 [Ascidiaceihabitans donghaensis]|uniref:Flp pilus assembly protein, pilin Flp n=1 Tax=Ascidiaceihabitans donghaensis TaxID=1510460 RepID=A0A2R8BBW8_9RHOB|nr:hypothetical protein [Ascidiaceihabitans donghaensis]SPH20545.1 hypothetical protein ASD8599_01282 [Ascidiaceihabitans donghaensis]
MLNFFKSFLKDEDGAITVDWIVLTAVLAGGGLLLTGFLIESVLALAAQIVAFLADWKP